MNIKTGFNLLLALLVSLLFACEGRSNSLTEETPDAPYNSATAYDTWWDPATKLTWQTPSTANRMTFADARDYCNSLNSNINGINGIVKGWRLPTRNELQTACGKDLGWSGQYWSSSEGSKPSGSPYIPDTPCWWIHAMGGDCAEDCILKTNYDQSWVIEWVGCVTSEGLEQGSSVQRDDYRRTVEFTGNWGDWTGSKFCPAGSYVAGIDQRVEPPQGGGKEAGKDDTALNSVAFYCFDKQGTMAGRICPHEGWWGDWNNSIDKCNPYYSPFMDTIYVKNESPQGDDDNTSMNSIRGRCGSTTLPTPSNEGSWGVWADSLACGSGEAICGLRIRLESDQGSGDDSAMNGIIIHCCAVN